MEIVDVLPQSIATDSTFKKFQRLLVERDFVKFANNIRPILENPLTPNRDVLVLLVLDAVELLGTDALGGESKVIMKLVTDFAPKCADLLGGSFDAQKNEARSVVPPLTPNLIQLRRVVQVTTYGCAGFGDSDMARVKRTVYRSPQERNFHRAVQLRYPGLLALPNYPLASAMNSDWIRHLVPRRTFRFYLSSTLDFLLVTPGEGDPIIAFELDSNFHDSVEASKRDKMKDELLELAGISLVRLRTENSESMTIDDWYAVLSDQIGEIPMPKRHRCREQSITFVPECPLF